jgi:transcriptional regulator with XRE-family HTH domain
MDTVASRLIILRGEQSRRSFATEMGVTESTLRNYEQGASLPNADFLGTVSKKLRISLAWLILGEGPMHLEDVAPASQAVAAVTRTRSTEMVMTRIGKQAMLEILEKELEHQRQLSESKDSEIAALRETIKAYKLALNAPNNRWGPFGNADTENGSQNTA